MRSVWKYAIPVQDDIEVEMPLGARVLAVQTQGGVPCIWALVDPDENERETRRFRIAGTGHPIENSGYYCRLVYIGTFQMCGGALVFHLFEKTPESP